MKTKIPRPNICCILVMALAVMSFGIAVSCVNNAEVLWKYPFYKETIVIGALCAVLVLTVALNFGRQPSK